MRVIIESDYQALSQWAANYVVNKINAAKPTAEKPFVLGLPTGSSPLGMYKALVEAQQAGQGVFQECSYIQHGRICRSTRVTS